MMSARLHSTRPNSKHAIGVAVGGSRCGKGGGGGGVGKMGGGGRDWGREYAVPGKFEIYASIVATWW